MSVHRHTYLYVIAAFVLVVALASCASSKTMTREASVPNTPSALPHPDRHLPRERMALIDEALEWMGTPYKYAGQTKGVETDCSGFVMQVYLTTLQLKLPRNSAGQAEFCSTLSSDEVQGGDLVFFATGSDPERVTHVGIMIDQVQFIHASSSKGVVISRMDNNWYATRFFKYGRVPHMQ